MDKQELGSRINQLYIRYTSNGEKKFWEKIAIKIGEDYGEEPSIEKARSLWRRWKEENGIDSSGSYVDLDSHTKEEVVPEGVVVIESSLDDDSIYTLDGLLEAFKVNLDEYSVERFIPNIWDGKRQAKAFLKRKNPEEFNTENFLNRIDSIVSARLKEQALDIPVVRESQSSRSLFIPCLFDSHIDSPFFNGDYVGVLKNIIEVGIKAGYTPARILFPIGNDFGHFDSNLIQTTGGTQMQSNKTYLDSVDERCRLILDACDLLRRYTRKLDIMIVPGNHDRFSSYWIGKLLGSYYRSDLNVTVINDHNPRKYYQYGRSMFGFTHGSDEKKTDLVGLMAVESPLMWASTESRSWFTGHLHQQSRTYSMLSEKFGVIQRIFPSLVNPDEWHVLKGYIGNDRAAELLLYDDDGKLGEFQLSIRSKKYYE